MADMARYAAAPSRRVPLGLRLRADLIADSAHGARKPSPPISANRAAWRAHDACELLREGASHGYYDDILVDQGLVDPFLVEQLKPELFEQACRETGQKLTLRMQHGYDHSYFFMASFIADHIDWHARRLA
jgi:S-formylglutathione hydrolase